MISLDTETTGVDLHHSARPFFVTTCDEQSEQRWWEWAVDPLTRQPQIPSSDLVEIEGCLSGHERVLQNAKFDVHALNSINASFGQHWPWDRTHDTLIAGHLLASNHPHNLTDMAVEYLGIDIQPYEDRLEEAVKGARKIAKKHYPEWMLAGKGVTGMPSAKEKTWKYDTWLPRAVANEVYSQDGSFPLDHPWWTVLSDYANADSFVTLKLWHVMEAELKKRDLWEIYLEKVKALPILYEAESRGLTVSVSGLRELRDEYREESEAAEALCVNIAQSMDFQLDLPKSGTNNSLMEFAFGILGLPVLKETNTGRPSLDQARVDEYKKILPAGSKQLVFMKSLGGKRKRDKSLEFLTAYDKFGLPYLDVAEKFLILHPSLNPTGTSTTRLSCSNPNLQQVSKQESMCEKCIGDGCNHCGGTGEDLHSVRRVFGPALGREWWTLDAENIELRLPAYESGEPDLIALFERPKDPPFYGSQHLLNLSIVYDDVWEEELQAVGLEKVGPHIKKKYASTVYQYTKNGDFAIQYQCGEATADRTFHRQGAFKKLKARFAKLEALNQRCVAYAEKYGWIETMPDKTVNPRHGYPLLCARGEHGRILSTVPLNYRIQGTAGWWMVKAMNRCQAKLLEWRAEGFDAYIALTVHDELVFDMPKHGDPTKDKSDERGHFRVSNRWRARTLQRLMAQGGDDVGVPTTVSVKYHPVSWADGLCQGVSL